MPSGVLLQPGRDWRVAAVGAAAELLMAALLTGGQRRWQQVLSSPELESCPSAPSTSSPQHPLREALLASRPACWEVQAQLAARAPEGKVAAGVQPLD